MRTDASISNSSSSGASSGEADAPRVLKQRFVLDEKLGSGGMGTVFRAKDLRKVEARDRQPFLAVKVLNNDFREHPEAFIALQREAAKSQTLSHSNIVSIFDFDKDGDVPFITMELLEGQELAQLLRAYPGGLPDQMAWEIIEGMCGGLQHAHEAGIVHADFKPGNVFISPKNAPKILDFGIARAVHLTETEGEDTLFDPARLAALTPAYASREMLNGDTPETRDDLYSLGIVIYLILTGHHPYGRLSADEAARDDLKPEKPRQLSRRQWRVLRDCLRFNRQDRPADVAEVQKFLLEPSPWRSRTSLVAALAFAVAFALNYFIQDADLTEVKQEVRQTTLLDSQVARISQLLDEPALNLAWEQSLSQELVVLQQLDGSHEEVDRLLGRLREIYRKQIANTKQLRVALDLLHRGSEFADMPGARALLQTRAFEKIQLLLDSENSDERWLAQLRNEITAMHDAFPGSPYIAELKLDVADVLEGAVRESVLYDKFSHAKAMLDELEPILFDAQGLEDLKRYTAAAKERLRLAEQVRDTAERRQQFAEQLDLLLDESCLRLDLNAVAAAQQQWLTVDPQAGILARQKISERVGTCIEQLAELDRDRVMVVRNLVVQLFGEDMLAEAQVVLDPCALNYLIGNGALSGRQGYCADRLPGDELGPRLVVVPAASGEGRFAMTKHEISWSQIAAFCDASGECGSAVQSTGDTETARLPDRPVRGITLASANSFAVWLSEMTGFIYRLPTVQEWQWAARGEPDPNRNCRVSIDGVARGIAPVATNAGLGNDFGLVHMLGNVQEWVMDAGDINVVGGAYADPIGECVAQTTKRHEGKPDSRTGFRLVREVS